MYELCGKIIYSKKENDDIIYIKSHYYLYGVFGSVSV